MSRHQFQSESFANRPANKPDSIFPDLKFKSDRFHFGLEAEYLLVRLPDYQPLWYQDLKFTEINEILEGIDLSGIEGDFGPLEIEPPHRKCMPYIVEGYHIPDENFKMVDILPKGVEIRTPVCDSLETCLKVYSQLYTRLQDALAVHGLKAVNLSHHPVETKFEGPMNKRRYDFWQWAMEVMTTYGPDINVSVPTHLLESFHLADFERKVNFYAPALAAVSIGSPFFGNDIWKFDAQSRGKSYRTFKRSVTAPAIEYHAEEGNRFEFKVFEMTPYVEDFKNYFLLFLTVLLSPSLRGRSEKAERIYMMGDVARYGLFANGMKERIQEVLVASSILREFDFDTSSLEKVRGQVEKSRTLSDELVDVYDHHGSIPKVLEYLSDLR